MKRYGDIVRELGLDCCGGVTSRGFHCRTFDNAVGAAERGPSPS
jgi:hypothetical protein